MSILHHIQINQRFNYLITSYTPITSQNILKQNKMKSEYQTKTRYSSESNCYSEEHQVFYYSNFDLFNTDQSQQEFYQFSIFIDQVSSELGSEWKNQANALFSPYLNSKEIFMNLLELWLRYHPPVNSVRTTPNESMSFNANYVTEFIQIVTKEISEKYSNVEIKPPQMTVKAVCLGFFMTANEIWDQMFKAESTQRLKQNPFKNTLFKGVTATLQKTFRPLMVVTEKIGSVFGKKKRKCNEDIVAEDCNQMKFQSCYNEFKKTLDIEKHLERKMSDFDLEDEEVINKTKIIQKEQFNQNDSPLQPSLIGNIYNYVTCFLNRNPSWQVASNFVTQILQLNQVILEEGKKVKVMRPAQEFYQKLIMIWLICQQVTGDQTTFQIFLTKLKSAFFMNSWHEKYIVPTKYFFQKMKKDWNEIKYQNPSGQTKQILQAFLKKIKISMKKDWETKMKIKNQA